MKKFTIAPADAADDMRRNYRREVRRHRERTQKRNRAIIVGAVAVVFVALVTNVAVARLAPKKELPKAAFEVRAEKEAKAKKAAAAKEPESGKKAVASKPKGDSAGSKKPAKPAAGSKTTAKKPAKPAAKPAGKKVAAAARKTPAAKTAAVTPPSKDAILVKVTKGGFGPDDIVVPLGKPVALFLEQAGDGEPIGFEIPTLGVQADNSRSAANVHVGSPSAGSYKFYSYNRSIEGTLTIK